MTPARFIAILIVIVALAYTASFFVAKRTSRWQINLTNSMASRFNSRFNKDQRLRVPADLRSGCIKGEQIFIPKTQPECQVTVVTNTARPVRKAEFHVSGVDSFVLRYEPSAKDKEAMPLEIKNFSQKNPAKLVFLENGGKLTFIRTTALGEALISVAAPGGGGAP